MRRCLHSLLVGVLAFSLSVDAARACGHLRRWRHAGPRCATPVVVVPCAHGCDPCGAFVVAGGCGWAGPVVEPCSCIVVAGCEEIACGTPLDCSSQVVVDAVPSAVAVQTPAAESVAAVPGEGSVVAPEPTPAAPEPSPVASAVPELEPVEPVSATEPAAAAEPDLTIPADVVEEPASPPAPEAAPEEPVVSAPDVIAEEPVAPVPAAVEPPPAAPPTPRNIFAEADEPADEGLPEADAPSTPAEPAEEAPVDAAAFEPAPEEPAVVPEPADEPAIETPDDLPAIEPEPSVDPAPEPAASAEPLRRWIDDTAAYAVVGRLVDVRGDMVEILKADGRSVDVPLARLSGFDRGYVAAAAPRLAAARRSAPLPIDTAAR